MGLITGGGASIAAGRFLGALSLEKKLPKKLVSSFLKSASRSLPLLRALGEASWSQPVSLGAYSQTCAR